MDKEFTQTELDEIFNVPFTFSVNCRKGHLQRCECWRCRTERDEPHDEATERLAAQMADEVDCDWARKNVPE